MRNRRKEQNDRKAGEERSGKRKVMASDEEAGGAAGDPRWRKVFVIAVFYFFPESRGSLGEGGGV
jgi:hypothetical protein